MSCSNQMKMCAFKKGMCDHVGCESTCPYYNSCTPGMDSTSIAELSAMYVAEANDRIASGKHLSINDVKRSISCMREFMEACGLDKNSPVLLVTHKNLGVYMESMKARNLSPSSIRTKLTYIKNMFCTWARRAYEERGRDIRPIELPEMPKANAKYHTPPQDRLTQLKIWFNRLSMENRPRLHAYAMCMYHFGMRNGDVNRLKWKNFTTDRGMTVLEYEPHKTKDRSSVKVKIEVSHVDWHWLQQLRGDAGEDDYVISGGGSHYGLNKDINNAMRELGFGGCKGAYELRKACGDEYNRKHDVNTAKAVLGHSMVTGATAHYVDQTSKIVPTIWE